MCHLLVDPYNEANQFVFKIHLFYQFYLIQWLLFWPRNRAGISTDRHNLTRLTSYHFCTHSNRCKPNWIYQFLHTCSHRLWWYNALQTVFLCNCSSVRLSITCPLTNIAYFKFQYTITIYLKKMIPYYWDYVYFTFLPRYWLL